MEGELEILKKRKIYEISVIDKTYSKIISDETKFYTSDTALELVFKLKETEYTFENAEIVLLNTNDKSLITRRVVKSDEGFVYTFEKDIIAHYGEWKCQLMLVENGEAHVSSPVRFRIENDLYNTKPQTLSDVVSWVNLKLYAEKLVGEFKQAVDEAFTKNVEIENTFKSNEQNRQTAFDNAEQSRKTTFNDSESERDETFNTNETARQSQELEREEAEATRQTAFDENEANRTETFNANEVSRQENETSRQEAENQRQSTFEVNESERQITFETAEQERQSAELTRVENEKQRNLTSVDEFIKLQNAVGGRNYLLKSGEPTPLTLVSNAPSTLPLAKGVENGVDWFSQHSNTTNKFIISTFISENLSSNNYGVKFSKDLEGYNGDLELSVDVMSTQAVTIRMGNGGKIKLIPDSWYRLETYSTRPLGLYADSADNENVPVGTKVYWKNYKIEKGTQATPYTKAPEDYEVVSKDDFYNHIKLINDAKDNQFNQLKQAVIALGGTI